VPDRNLTYQDLLQIVELIKSSAQFSEFRLKVGDVEIDIKRTNGAAAAVGATPAEPEIARQRRGHAGGGELVVEPAVSARAPEHRTGPAAFPGHWVLVRSPMVGTFYCAPEPGARPFVEVGQRVETDTTVCIIEVMKLINSIPAGHSGVVKQILVGDAELVGDGQVLMVIDPRG
jgi:acetyl-CoA carboxylase biotin carboxyl carrier protein